MEIINPQNLHVTRSFDQAEELETSFLQIHYIDNFANYVFP